MGVLKIKMYVYDMELDKNMLPVLVVQEEIYGYSTEKLNMPQKIVDLFRLEFGLHRKAEEFVYMIAFNTAMNPLGVFMVGKGTVNACVCSSREIFLRALAVGATSIVIIHNHPSGDTTPSNSDKLLLERLKESGILIGIELSDFIIIGDNEHFSACAMGLLD